MLYPSIDKLLEVVDSKYKLVTIASKRARQIQDEKKHLIEKPKSLKPVGIALEEIQEGKITFEQEDTADKK